MQWRIHWSRNRQLAVVVLAIGLSGFLGYFLYHFSSNQLLVCPGCNPPEMLTLDHYNIQNNTDGRPSLLTIWLRSTGPRGKTLLLKDLFILDGPTEYSFTTTSVSIPALSVVPVTVDTSVQNFYFVSGQSYGIGLVTDQYESSGFTVSYPPQTLVMESYTVGYGDNQPNATVLTLGLVNRGTASVSLMSLELRREAANSTLFTFQMNGPTIDTPGGSAQVVLNTNSSSFYFVHQQFYTLTIIPSIGPVSSSLILFQ